MTEDQIERICERTMDKLDHELLNGLITETLYNEEVKALDEWANLKHRELKNGS